MLGSVFGGRSLARLVFTALLLAFASASTFAQDDGSWRVSSPNGELRIDFRLMDKGEVAGCPVYSISYRGKPIIGSSALGLELEGAPDLTSGLVVDDVSRSQRSDSWRPVWGERSPIPDRYNEMVVRLHREGDKDIRLNLIFRAYDEGGAFYYEIPEQPGFGLIRITREMTHFNVPNDADAWTAYRAQADYKKATVGDIKSGCERPLTIRLPDGPYLALGEARLVRYPRMKFAPAKDGDGLVSNLSGEVRTELPRRSPWRFVMVGETPGELLEHNYLLLNLNDPRAIDDTSWIKPGKVIREVTLSTAGAKALVDFAARHDIEYIEFDAGWYGPEGSAKSDASTVTPDPKRSKRKLDLQEAIDYAHQHGVGVIVYVNHQHIEKQMDEIFPLYEKWGIDGVKFGFVNVGSQHWTSWLHHAVCEAAKHHLVVDVHDEYRPTGYSRTYPNLMTQEGIAGDETTPSTANTLTILFTRMLAGAGDNTVCYYNPRVDEHWTHAHQLAKSVIMFSPLQFIFWYDHPPTSEEPPEPFGPGIIGDEPELEFFKHLPTTWDETKVLDGEIGKYATVARRGGDEWFVGSMNAEAPRQFQIPLSFLDPDLNYTAHVYSHDPEVDTRTHVRIEQQEVNSSTVLNLEIKANSGLAMRIVPQ